MATAQKTYLVIGSGGREHALAWKLSDDAGAPTVWVAPGNVGIEADPQIRGGCVDLTTDDFEGLAAFAREHDVDLTVVGPEAPLCAGLVDHFRAQGLPIFGPTRVAARLEGSKAFAKEIMVAAGVPTADYAYFDDLDAALDHVRNASHPMVIKADGLAGGKGVVIAPDVETSEATLRAFMGRTGEDSRFGAASRHVVIEACLSGPELSFMVVTDGEAIVPLSTSRDHKRLGDGDTGPNTGGMGAVTPSPDDLADPGLRERLLEQVIRPTLAELASRGIPYRGFLYAGVMLTTRGPQVLEFNCRLGDPETQALLFAMEHDLGPALEAAAAGRLGEWDGTLATDQTACCVVLASQGYPARPRTGQPIDGLDAVDGEDVKVFHAGTERNALGHVITAGGRVLGVTARGPSIDAARRRAYAAVDAIDWTGMQYRSDIGR